MSAMSTLSAPAAAHCSSRAAAASRRDCASPAALRHICACSIVAALTPACTASPHACRTRGISSSSGSASHRRRSVPSSPSRVSAAWSLACAGCRMSCATPVLAASPSACRSLSASVFASGTA
eukprot:3394350-Prymnesium_polylepis.1